MKKRRFLAILLTLAMVISMTPVTTFAVDATTVDPVARIDDVGYESLEKAIEAVKSKQTITMLANVEGAHGISVPSGKNFTVDFDNHTYSVEKPGAGSANTQTQAFQLLKGSTIIFKNGTISCTEANKTATVDGDGLKPVKMMIQNYANLTLDNMTIDGTNINREEGKVRYIVSNNSGKVVINNTTIKTVDDDIALDTCRYGTYDVPTVELKGTSNVGTIALGGGNLKLTAGTVGALKVDGIGDGVITKGSKVTVAAPEGYEWIGSSTQTLTKVTYDARIGTTTYLTLAAAVETANAATKAQTITLCRDASGAGLFIEKTCPGMTIDLNGHTYTVTGPAVGSTGTQTQALHIESAKFTLKNGTLTSTENSGVKMLVQNYSGLTLSGVTLDGFNLPDSGRYVLSNNQGSVTINLNSKIIAKNGDFALDACKYGDYTKPTVTVTDTEINGKVEITGGTINLKSGAVVNGQIRVGENKYGGATGGTLTVNAGAKINNSGNYAIVAFGKNTVTINDGEINGIIGTNGNAYNAGSTISVKGGKITENNDVAMYIPNGKLTISGGTITGTTAVYFKSTNLTISGGELKATGDKVAYQYNGSGCNATGDALVIDNCNYPCGITAVAIKGGTFTSANGSGVGYYQTNTDKIPNITCPLTITEENLPSLNEGYEWFNNGKAYALAKGGIVAKVGTDVNRQYATLADAVASAKSGETITLVKDASGAGLFIEKDLSSLTIDLNGHTYTVTGPAVGSTGTETQGLHIESTKFTLKNGTLKSAADSGVKMLVQNYSGLTLSGVTLDGSKLEGSGRYVLSNNQGTSYIKEGSKIIAKEGDFALDACKYGNYTKPAVTVTDTDITGKVEVTGGTIGLKSGAVVNGQIRVGENKDGGATGGALNVYTDAKINNPGKYAIVVFGKNTVTINDGEINGIIGTNGNEYNAGSTISVKGGTITEANDVAMYIPNGTLTISGGTITGKTAVYFKANKLTISGGELKATGDKADYKYDGNGCNATGDALVIDNCNYPTGISSVSITGGTFTVTDDSCKQVGYYEHGEVTLPKVTTATTMDDLSLSDGYYWYETTTKTLKKATTVAKIGETGYAFLQDAFDAAAENDTVKLVDNVNTTEQLLINSGKKIKLDLNGFKIAYTGVDTLASGIIGVKHGGTLTVTDESAKTSGSIYSSSAKAYAAVAMTVKDDTDESSPAVLVVEKGNLQGYYYGIVGNGSEGRGNTHITINGGAVKGYCKNDNTGIYNPQSGSLTINGGTISGATGIYIKAGNPITISGGSITGSGEEADFVHSDNGFNSTGDALVIENCGYPGGAPAVSITGGTFKSTNAYQLGYYEYGNVNIADVSSSNANITLPDGYGWSKSGKLFRGSNCAMIGNITYQSIEEAFDAVNKGETIKLIEDVAVTEQLIVDKDVILDLAGKTIEYKGETTLASGVIGIKHGGNLTIKDSSKEKTGAIKSGNKAYAAVAMTIKGDTNDAKPAVLTVKSGTLEGYYYGITGNGSEGRGNTKVFIQGGTVKGTATNDNTGIYNPQSGTLVISGGTVEGATGVYVKAGNPVTVSGGTIKGTGAKSVYNTKGDGFDSTGDGFVVDNCDYPGGKPVLTIKGGTFESTNGAPIASYAKVGETAIVNFVKDGKFNNTIEASLIASGFTLSEAAVEGYYTITAEDPHTHVFGVWKPDDNDESIHSHSCDCGEKEIAPHEFSAPTVSWSFPAEGYTTATFRTVCSVCGKEIETAKAGYMTDSSDETKTVWTATATIGGKQYTATKEVAKTYSVNAPSDFTGGGEYAYGASVTITPNTASYFDFYLDGVPAAFNVYTLTFKVTGNVIVTAVEHVEQNNPVLRMEVDLNNSVINAGSDGKYKVPFKISWAIDDSLGITVQEVGYIYRYGGENGGTIDTATVLAKGSVKISTLKSLNGYYKCTHSFGSSYAGRNIYAIGYMTYTKGGETYTIYTDTIGDNTPSCCAKLSI